MGDWETAMVTVGVDGAAIYFKSKILRSTHQQQITMGHDHVVLPMVTVGGPTAGLGRCLERARTVIM